MDLCFEPTGAVAEKKLSAKLTDEGDSGADEGMNICQN